VISGHDIPIIYNYPFQLLEEEILTCIFNKLKVGPRKIPLLATWKKLVDGIEHPKETITIGIGGKYTQLGDAYVSITKALTHAGASLRIKVTTTFIETTSLNVNLIQQHLEKCDGIIIPGGFGQRGIEGKIKLVTRIRENPIPFLGICLGFQCAVIEYARNVCGMESANSTEFNPDTPFPIIDLLPSQKKVYRKGGSMRLGAYPVKIKENTLAHKIYTKNLVQERFRHRYEVNPDYVSRLENEGFLFSGKSQDNSVVHIGELPTHPFFLGTQYHPEFLSRFESPSSVFKAFVEASLIYKKRKNKED
jgi:CTP synthase